MRQKEGTIMRKEEMSKLLNSNRMEYLKNRKDAFEILLKDAEEKKNQKNVEFWQNMLEMKDFKEEALLRVLEFFESQKPDKKTLNKILFKVAQTGDEVLQKIQEQEPDILIMDVILPGLDGLSALRELQELGYAPMTILTSAFVSDQTLAEATELGAAYFLPKPFRTETLLDRMRNLFREKPKATRPSLKARVTHMLHDAGMPANISGYQYLREAILITAADPSVLNKAVTKILYPEIARRYGTTALRVERCIRSAIEIAWDRASPETLPKYFGCTVSSQRGKPSNAEFIALLAERLTLEDDQALRA